MQKIPEISGFLWREESISRSYLHDLIWEMGVINAARRLAIRPMNLLDAIEAHNIPRPPLKYWWQSPRDRPGAKQKLPRRAPHGEMLVFIRGVNDIVKQADVEFRRSNPSPEQFRRRNNRRARDRNSIENEKAYLDGVGKQRRTEIAQQKQALRVFPRTESLPLTIEEIENLERARYNRFGIMIDVAMARESGMSITEISRKFGRSTGTIRIYLRNLERRIQFSTKMPRYFMNQIFRPRCVGEFPVKLKNIDYDGSGQYSSELQTYSRSGGLEAVLGLYKWVLARDSVVNAMAEHDEDDPFFDIREWQKCNKLKS